MGEGGQQRRGNCTNSPVKIRRCLVGLRECCQPLIRHLPVCSLGAQHFNNSHRTSRKPGAGRVQHSAGVADNACVVFRQRKPRRAQTGRRLHGFRPHLRLSSHYPRLSGFGAQIILPNQVAPRAVI